MAGGSSRVLLAATVTDIGNGPSVYAACSQCYCKLIQLENNSQSKCPKCSRVYKIEEIYHRFRLSATITDFLSTANITAFGGMLDVFFGANASEFNKKIMCLKEKYCGVWQELVKLAIEQTFVGQSLLFGFKVNPTVLKKSLSQLPRRQVLLSDVVCDSHSTGLHIVNSSAPKLMRDLIAVQIAHHRKPDQDFRTVIDSLNEIIRFVDERCKAQVLFDKENLRDAMSHLFNRGLASFVNQTNQSFSSLAEERSRTESLCSDSSISSGSDLSSIRLSCDSSIQEIKHNFIKVGTLMNITNVENEMSNCVPVRKESTEESRSFLMKSMISNHVVETDQQHNVSYLRRSKRISEKRRNGSNASFHANESGKADDTPQSKERERRGRYDKELNDISWCTRKHKLIAQKAVFPHDTLCRRTTCISTSTASCSSACSESNSQIHVQNSFHQSSCESGNTRMRSKSSAPGCETLEASVLPTTEFNAQIVLRSHLNQSHSKNEVREVNGIGFERSSNQLNLHYDALPQKEPIFKTVSHLRHVSKSSPSTLYSVSLDSDMEITKNTSTELDHSLKKAGCFYSSFMHNSVDRLEQTEKTIDEIQGKVEEFPESENLSAFLKAGQLNSVSYEIKLGHLKRHHCDRMNGNKILKTEKLAQNINYLSQGDMLNISNRNRHCSEDNDMVLSQLDHVSFSNVTFRRKSKQKRKKSKVQVKMYETDLIGSTAIYEGCQSQTQISEASDIMAAPESEDFYVFLGGVRLDLQETLHSSIENVKRENKGTLLSIKKERDCFASIRSEHGDESNHTFRVESQVEISEPPSTSFVEGKKCDFEHVSKDYSELCSTDEKNNDMFPAEITLSDKDRLTTNMFNSDNILMDYRVPYHSESVIKDNSNCLMGQDVPPFNPHLNNFTQFTMKVRKTLENLTENSSTINTGTRLSNDLSSPAQSSPPHDVSFDLFEDSSMTSNGSSEQCEGALHNYDSDETECAHSYRCTTAVNSERSFPENCESYQRHTHSFNSPAKGHHKVKFNKRQKEIIFHDFEIISHLPVPTLQTKILKSCLKKEPIPQRTSFSNGCSQDLFDSPSQSSLSESLEGEMNIFSQNQYALNNDLESCYMKSTKSILDQATPVIYQNSINGSQDMFSSGDTDFTDSSRTEVNSLVTTNSFGKERLSKLSKEADYSLRFTLSKHDSPTAIPPTDAQMLSSKIRSSAQISRDSQRDSLDLFSPSVSQRTCERVSSSNCHDSFSPSPTIRCQRGGRERETPDLFSADSE